MDEVKKQDVQIALDETTVLEIIIAIFLPPLAVLLKRKAIDVAFVLNLLLTIFGFWILGVIHALIVVCAKEQTKFVGKMKLR